MGKRLNFSLTQLEYVLAVYKLGSFSAAAKHCSITQPTLSMQIQKLEEEWETVIFDRKKKPILLTNNGKKIVEQMQTILFEAKKIDQILKLGESKAISGDLIIGVIPTIAPYLLPRLLPTMEKNYPGISLKIFELQTHRILEELESDEIDLGILAIPLSMPKFSERILYTEPFSVLCQKTHNMCKGGKIKYHSLEAEDIWLLEEGHCLRSQVVDVCSLRKNKKVTRKYQFESGSLETIKNLVSSYGGYTLLPALAAETYADNVCLLPFEAPIPAREIGMVFIREHYKSALLEALAIAIQKSVPQSLVEIKPKGHKILPV